MDLKNLSEGFVSIFLLIIRDLSVVLVKIKVSLN